MLNVVKAAAEIVFYVMTLVMLFSKKWSNVREIEKEMEMCLWATKW